MKKERIELFSPFINQNGHLSIVYKRTMDKLYIVNYQGNFYLFTMM